ncbi:hypothetical protein RJ639_046472, partial [Escallonia herrerae]
AENRFDDKSKVQDHDVVEEPEGDARELEIHQKDAESGNEIHHKDGIDDYEFMEEPEEDVQELQIHQKDVGSTKQETEKMAVELLAKRAYTAVELKRKLLGKRCDHNIVDAVIVDFQSRGLINDCLYAETYSRSRLSSSSWGPRRIKQVRILL